MNGSERIKVVIGKCVAKGNAIGGFNIEPAKTLEHGFGKVCTVVVQFFNPLYTVQTANYLYHLCL